MFYQLRKLNISILSVLTILVGACSDSTVASKSCTKSGPTSAIQSLNLSAMAFTSNASDLSIMIKVKNVKREIQSLRQDLLAAHNLAAGTLGKITLMAMNNEWISLQIPKGSPALALIDRKTASGEFLFVEPDYQTFLVAPGTPQLFNDPDLSQQWAQEKMDTYDAWKITRGDQKLIVAVIDTGVDYTHKDLQNSMWKNEREILNGLDDDGNGYIDDVYGYDFANNDSDPMADDTKTFHGTHVAGTIAASLNNNLGGAGIAPNVKIMALKYLDQNGSGKTSDAVRAIDYAIKNGAKIINNSWGSRNYSQALQDAIEKARTAGVLFVAAAGNGDYNGNGLDIDQFPFYPAGYPSDNVVSVAASDRNDNLAKWSNFGFLKVDVAAPGVNILSTRNGNIYATLSGTSMASPAVTGVLGLIWSANPDLNYSDVKKILLTSVDKIASVKGKLISGGRVNAARAVQMASNSLSSGPISPIVAAAPSQCGL